MALLAQILFWISLTTIGVQCEPLKVWAVTTVLEAPYVMVRETSDSNALVGNDRYEGYIVDLLSAIANHLSNFKYSLNINPTGDFGLWNSSGWSGMVGEIINEKADIIAASMTITAERESAIDFTVPYMGLGIAIMYKIELSEKRTAWDSFLDIFYPFMHYVSTNVAFVLTLVFGIALLVLRRKYKTLLFKILLAIWLLFLFFFAALYIAQLSSRYNQLNTFGAYDPYKHDFNTIDDLASQDTVVFGCKKGGSTEAFFANSANPLYKKMYEKMKESESASFVSSNFEGMNRVHNGSYAYISESTIIEYATSRFCDYRQIGGLLDSKGYGLAVRQGSPLREYLNSAILKLQEDGTLATIKSKWWNERNGGGNCQ